MIVTAALFITAKTDNTVTKYKTLSSYIHIMQLYAPIRKNETELCTDTNNLYRRIAMPTVRYRAVWKAMTVGVKIHIYIYAGMVTEKSNWKDTEDATAAAQQGGKQPERPRLTLHCRASPHLDSSPYRVTS